MSDTSLTTADLERIHAFRGLPTQELEELLAAAPLVELLREEQLSDEGVLTEGALLVVRGLLRVFVSQGGQPVLVGEIWPGEVCGEEALFQLEEDAAVEPPRNASVVAAVNTVAIRLTPELLEQARGTRTLAAMQAHLIHTLADRIQSTNLGMRKAWLEQQVREPMDRPMQMRPPRRRWGLLSLLTGRS